MRQAANQIARGNLLGMLQLFLAQASLVIHGRHLKQDQHVRQPLGSQRKDV